ncbi:MAG: hypothetical protein ACREML_11950, partial [Vulcanimicrobiaceae bacterium]
MLLIFAIVAAFGGCTSNGNSPHVIPYISPSPTPVPTPTTTPQPGLTSLSVTSGLIGTTVVETLTGIGFITGATVNVSGSGITASSVVVNSATSITAALFIDAEASTGPRNVTVTTAG